MRNLKVSVSRNKREGYYWGKVGPSVEILLFDGIYLGENKPKSKELGHRRTDRFYSLRNHNKLYRAKKC